MWSSIRFGIWYFQLPISYIYPPTFYAVSDKFTIFVPLKTTKMKKGLKYTLICLGCLVVLAGVGLGIMYVVSPYKVKRWVGW